MPEIFQVENSSLPEIREKEENAEGDSLYFHPENALWTEEFLNP